MAIVADIYRFVVGVDTHAKTHTYAVIDTRAGAVACTDTFPASSAGMKRALAWIKRRTDGPTLMVVECIGSYGAKLAAFAASEGYSVVEPHPTPKAMRAGRGKSDPVDAELIAKSVLGVDTARLRQPRNDEGVRAALRVLVVARDTMTTERTANVNALTALVRTVSLGIDAPHPLTHTQVATIAAWHTRTEAIDSATARGEAIRLAKRICALDQEIAVNHDRMEQLIRATPAAGLLEKKGIGPVTAAVVLTAWSHAERIHSEAAFAALAGVSPIPASSGNTTRFRLNRSGDRRLNRALHLAAVARMGCDPDTRAYVEKRLAEGKTKKEILRVLKRYLARQIYRYLNNPTPQPTTA